MLLTPLIPLGRRSLQILRVLRDHPASSITEIAWYLDGGSRLALSPLLACLWRLEKARLVRHEVDSQGAWRWRPCGGKDGAL